MKNALGTKEDLDLFDKNGIKVYSFYAESDGCLIEGTYDSNGKELTYEDSDGYSCKYTRDSNGNELTFEDSSGLRRGFTTPECTIEELFEKIRNY